MANLQNLMQDVQKAIPAYLHKKGLSQNELSKTLKINAAIISNMINGNWSNISEEKWRKVWGKVRPQAEIYETADTKAGFIACEKAAKKHLMIALIADTGMSKTTVLETIATRANTYYVYIDFTVSPKVFLKALLAELGAGFEGGLNEMLNRVAHELNSKTNPLLLIDECAKINHSLMLILHSLRDKTKHNCGIVLAGMPDFKNKIIKFSNKGTTGYAEFQRRIEIWHEFKGLSNAEIKYILEDNGITDTEEQREFRSYKRIGELANAINVHKEVNA